MNNAISRIYKPPIPTLTQPYAQIKWMFFQLEAEYAGSRAASFRYAKEKYLQFISETNAYYKDLESNQRFFLNKYWEPDALTRFVTWLSAQALSSKTRYSIYKLVRQVMDMAYALRVIDTIIYHAPMFKGVSETKQRVAYTEREQQIINAALARWIGLSDSVLRGYAQTGEGVPYRRKNSFGPIIVDGHSYTIAEAAEIYGIRHDQITLRLQQGWTPHQAVGLERYPKSASLNWKLNGVLYQSIAQVAEAFGLAAGVIRSRIKKGWSPEQIAGIAPVMEKKLARQKVNSAQLQLLSRAGCSAVSKSYLNVTK